MTNVKEFRVIGAGLGRTGTASTKEALEILLPGKCYHTFVVPKETNDHHYFWSKTLMDETTDEEFAEFFLSRGYVAALAYPFYACFDQARRAFPHAKVLVTVRDPKEWMRSIEQTVMYYSKSYEEMPLFPFVKFGLFSRYLFYIVKSPNIVNKTMHNITNAVSEGRGEEFFTAWVEDKIRKVPDDQLLIYSVKEGWEPLCKFLDVPVPDVPFPRVNESKSFQNMVTKRKRRAWLLLFEIVSFPILTFFVYKYWR